MRQIWFAAAACAVMAVGFVAPAWADPFDDAFDSYIAGDFAVALEKFAPLAQAGDIRAQYMLGRIYSEGEGVEKNDAEGAKWYRLAADRGDVVSQLSLGTMYVNGRGVPQNFVEAYKWLSLVTKGGSRTTAGQALEVRELIAQMMTPEQIDEAEQLAESWTPQ